MKLFALITDNDDHAPGITIFQDQAKAKAKYDETELDDYTKCKYLTSIEEGVDFGWSISSGGEDPFYGADVIEKDESDDEDGSNESIKPLKYVKLFESFLNEREETNEDNFKDLYGSEHTPKEINEDADKDRYAQKIKDIDEVRPRMAPAPKTDGMMASQGSKYFDLYLQDEASYVCVDKYGYTKGIANWEWMINQSSGAMFAATAKIANEKYKMLRDLGLLEDYGKDYFKRSYFDLWKEWKEFMKSGKKQVHDDEDEDDPAKMYENTASDKILSVTIGTDFEKEVDKTLERLKDEKLVSDVKKSSGTGDSIIYEITFTTVEGAFLFGKSRPQVKI